MFWGNQINVAPYSTTIEIEITSATKTRYTLPDDEILRNRKIIGVSTRVQDGSNNKETLTGRPLPPPAVQDTMFLTLVADQVEVIKDLPFEYFSFDSAEGGRDKYLPLELLGFLPTKSEITIADPTGLTTSMSIELTFFYTE